MFLQDAPISKILYCSKIYTKPDKILVNDGRHAHALVFFIEGESDYIYGDQTLSASPGTVLFLPKDKKYLIHRYSTAQCIYVDFLTVNGENFLPFAKKYPNSAQFRDTFTNLLSSYKQKRIGYEAEMMSLLYKLVSMIQIAERALYFPNAKYQKIADSIDYIRKNYSTGQIKISQLASMSGMSTRYFSELFSVFFGISPKEYIIQMQLETAKNLLISSSASVTDISETCGFSDVYYFSKVFKKEFGQTPSMFRRINKVL